jgi:hypothetical protein
VSLLERAAILSVSLALTAGLIGLLSGFFTSRDRASVTSAGAPGRHFRDLGDALLAPGELRPPYDSSPPTSGAHVPEPVTRDETDLSNDQLLQALSLGDVVIGYGGQRPSPALTALARSLAAPFSRALAAAGQAVILARMPGTTGLVGLAWTRMIRVASPADPRLRAFALHWLGRGFDPRQP